MKKFISFVLVLALCFIPSIIFATNGKDYYSDSSFESFLSIRIQNEPFASLYEKDPDGVTANLLEVYKKQLQRTSDQTRWLIFPEEVAAVSTVLVMQPDGYTCGPTSGYMALYGAGQAGYIPGTTHADKIYYLANYHMYTYYFDGTGVEYLTYGLNDYLGYWTYVYDSGSYMGFNSFCGNVFSSLLDGYIPILHADTTSLSYYGGSTYYHYIAIQKYDSVNNYMTLYDCNCYGNFYGAHNVSPSDAFSTISSGRFLIYE